MSGWPEHHARDSRRLSLSVVAVLVLLSITILASIGGAEGRFIKAKNGKHDKSKGVEAAFKRSSHSREGAAHRGPGRKYGAMSNLEMMSHTYAKKKEVRSGRMQHPPMHGFANRCYAQNIWGSFDNIGWSMCSRPGYLQTGMFRNTCNNLHCIEELWCCQQYLGDLMSTRQWAVWMQRMAARKARVEAHLSVTNVLVNAVTYTARKQEQHLTVQAVTIRDQRNRLNSLEAFRHWSEKRWGESDSQLKQDGARLKQETKDNWTLRDLTKRLQYLLQMSLEKETISAQEANIKIAKRFKKLKWSTKKKMIKYTKELFSEGQRAEVIMKYKDTTSEFNLNVANKLREAKLEMYSVSRQVANQIEKFTQVTSTIEKAAVMKKYMEHRENEADHDIKKQEDKVDKLEVETERVAGATESIEAVVNKEEKERRKEFAGTARQIQLLKEDQKDLKHQVDDTYQTITDMFKKGDQTAELRIPEADYEQLQSTLDDEFAGLKKELFSQMAEVAHKGYEEKRDGYLRKLAEMVKNAVEEFVSAGGATPLDGPAAGSAAGGF